MNSSTRAAVSSVEPSSITSISIASCGYDCAAIESSACTRRSAQLYVGTMTLTVRKAAYLVGSGLELALPGERSLRNEFEIVAARLPIEHLANPPGIGNQRRRVAGTARMLERRYRGAVRAADRRQHVAHRVAVAV